MSDILERLRVQARSGLMFLPHDFKVVSYGEAADEIARLREDLSISLSYRDELVSSNDQLGIALSEAEQRAKDEWKPIETAPKDGSKVILFTVHPGDDFGEPLSKVQIGSWQEGNGLPIDHDFYREPEWETQWVGEPTHWRPLPSPPVLIPLEPHDAEGRE